MPPRTATPYIRAGHVTISICTSLRISDTPTPPFTPHFPHPERHSQPRTPVRCTSKPAAMAAQPPLVLSPSAGCRWRSTAPASPSPASATRPSGYSTTPTTSAGAASPWSCCSCVSASPSLSPTSRPSSSSVSPPSASTGPGAPLRRGAPSLTRRRRRRHCHACALHRPALVRTHPHGPAVFFLCLHRRLLRRLVLLSNPPLLPLPAITPASRQVHRHEQPPGSPATTPMCQALRTGANSAPTPPTTRCVSHRLPPAVHGAMADTRDLSPLAPDARPPCSSRS